MQKKMLIGVLSTVFIVAASIGGFAIYQNTHESKPASIEAEDLSDPDGSSLIDFTGAKDKESKNELENAKQADLDGNGLINIEPKQSDQEKSNQEKSKNQSRQESPKNGLDNQQTPDEDQSDNESLEDENIQSYLFVDSKAGIYIFADKNNPKELYRIISEDEMKKLKESAQEVVECEIGCSIDELKQQFDEVNKQWCELKQQVEQK